MIGLFVVATSALGFVGVPAAAAHGPALPLTSAASSRPAHTAVVGRSTASIVYNDLSNHVVYLGNPGKRAVPKVLVRNARATAVSGDMVEYTQGGAQLWRNLRTSKRGIVPSTWTFLAPDGGLRVRQHGGQTTLDYLHLDGSIKSYPLPASLPTGHVHYSVVATPDGIAVAASKAKSVPRVAYSDLKGTDGFAALRTTGLRRGAALRCTSLSGAAVGCQAGRSAIRLATDGTTDPQASTLSAMPLGVGVTDAYTSWTTPRDPSGTTCPCNMASIDTSGTAISIVSGLTAGPIVAGGGRFFYSRGTDAKSAGVYVDLFAGAGDRLVARAARRPLRSTAPALGPGRATWVDDSRGRWVVWAAHIGPHSGRGPMHRQATGARLGKLAVSGPRTVYTAAGGSALHLLYDQHDKVIAHGALVALSGSQLLFRGAHRRLVLRDLVHGGRVDETAAHGAIAAALSGRYLSYVRANGAVWRLDTDRPAHPPVRLAPAVGGTVTSGAVYSWGDWTAWTIGRAAGKSRVSRWRNAAMMTPEHRLSGSRRPYAASAGGLVVGIASGSYALLSWTSGATRTQLPGSGAAPAVEGNTVGWLRDGVPTVAAIGVRVRNRPRGLGNPAVGKRIAGGKTWRLELPTSAPLTRCVVTVARGDYHRRIGCGPAWQARGDVLVRWHTGAAPTGRYTWTVHAAGVGGTLLTSRGRQAPTTGTVTVG
jgi:hypothetical protein